MLGRILSQYHLVSFAKCLIYQMKPQNVRLISSICELLFFLYFQVSLYPIVKIDR